MDSETPQTKEIDSKTDEGKAPENDQDTAIAGGTEGAQKGGEGGGHDNKSDSSDAAADMEGDPGDLVRAATAGAIVDDTKEPKGEKNGGEDSSPQAERDTDASEETKKDEDASESDAQKAQSEPEATEKVPLDMDEEETGEEKEKEEGLQYKVRFDVSGDSSTEAAGEETKVDPTTAAATDAEQGLGTPTKQPLSSTESERGKEPAAWYSRTSLLITSVFSIFCFFPMGIVALYYGMKVKDAYHSKHEAAKIKDYARRSTFCSVAAITTGIITLILILVVTILGITGVVR